MRHVQASDAATQLFGLLDEVERGETIVIIRNDRPVARIIPDPEFRRKRTEAAMAGIRKLREKDGRITLEELLSAHREGHKILG